MAISDRARRVLQFATAALAGAAGVVLGAALSEHIPFSFWLQRWQTLVAGVLAVGAAGVTVFQMQRTDEQQQVRHDELMWLNLRGDRLIASRAAHAHADALRRQAEVFEQCMQRIGSWRAEAYINQPHPDADETWQIFSQTTGKISSALRASDFAAAQNLFDPNADVALNALKSVLGNVEPFRIALRNALHLPTNTLWPQPVDTIDEHWESMETIGPTARAISDELTRLRQRYDERRLLQ